MECLLFLMKKTWISLPKVDCTQQSQFVSRKIPKENDSDNEDDADYTG